MRKQDYRLPIKDGDIRNTLLQRLVYIPGALILVYGCWLSLTA
jgi:hypothetical protein